uniref:Uncharacterized protein n=1 Tax=Esox lucius TaxID=8010 RepID=A0A3P8ZBK5_ESOLU
MACTDTEEIKTDFLQYEKTEDKVEYLKQVTETVSKHCNASIPLRKPEGSEWKIGGQDVTCYSEDDGTVKEWGIFYLPEIVKMEILGAVENLPFPTECGQLVIMLCEDRHVYAYDGEEMHLVASSLKDLFDSGLQYPGFSIYYRGECFKDMVRIQKLEKEHQELLKTLQQRLKLIQSPQASGGQVEDVGSVSMWKRMLKMFVQKTI